MDGICQVRTGHPVALNGLLFADETNMLNILENNMIHIFEVLLKQAGIF